jgi:uncharacterized protein (DUF58 family)
MLLGPMWLNWRAVKANLRGLDIARKLPVGLCAGDPLSVGLQVTNTRPRLGMWAVFVEDPIRRLASAGMESHRHETIGAPAVIFPYVPAGESRKGGYRGRLCERGRYQFGPIRLFTRFPFGLFLHTITLGESETLLVLPRLGQLQDGWMTRRFDALSGARGRPGAEGDFYGVRPWRNGDGRRLIHWRGSARRGSLVVRQFERPRSRDMAIVLDLWQPESPADSHRENVELAVSFAATILADLCRKGGSIAILAINDPGPEFQSGSASTALLQELMERLATVESYAHDLLPTLLASVLQEIAVDTEIVLVSTRPNDLSDAERFAAIWADPMAHERVKHILCVDTSSEKLADVFQVET